MRKIFYSVPKYNLSHYVNCQMELFTQQTDSLLSRSPKVVTMLLSHLKTLHISSVVTKKKILSSFYNLDDKQLFDSPWDSTLELRLSLAKECFNKGEYQPSKESDIRILSQCLLDFLEGLASPALSQNTLDQMGLLKDQNKPEMQKLKVVC